MQAEGRRTSCSQANRTFGQHRLSLTFSTVYVAIPRGIFSGRMAQDCALLPVHCLGLPSIASTFASNRLPPETTLVIDLISTNGYAYLNLAFILIAYLVKRAQNICYSTFNTAGYIVAIITLPKLKHIVFTLRVTQFGLFTCIHQ